MPLDNVPDDGGKRLAGPVFGRLGPRLGLSQKTENAVQRIARRRAGVLQALPAAAQSLKYAHAGGILHRDFANRS
jgi:hypothetical protein